MEDDEEAGIGYLLQLLYQRRALCFNLHSASWERLVNGNERYFIDNKGYWSFAFFVVDLKNGIKHLLWLNWGEKSYVILNKVGLLEKNFKPPLINYIFSTLKILCSRGQFLFWNYRHSIQWLYMLVDIHSFSPLFAHRLSLVNVPQTGEAFNFTAMKSFLILVTVYCTWSTR